MRYTRFEFKGDVGIWRSILKFLILIPAAALVLGLVLSKLFIIMASKENRTSNTTTNAYSYEAVAPCQFFIVQAGIYSLSENASSAVKRIESRGLPAYSYVDGQYYRVISYIAASKDDADAKRHEYINNGLDSIVKELDINTAQIPDDMKQDTRFILLNRMLNCCGKEQKSCLGIYKQYESSQIDLKSLKKSLQVMDSELGEKLKELKGAAGGSDTFYNRMINLCLDYQSSLTGGTDGDEFSHTAFEERIIKSIYIYNDIIKAYNDNISGGQTK